MPEKKEVDTNTSASQNLVHWDIAHYARAQRQAPVNVRPIAEELAQMIINRSQDGRLNWSADGRVRVLTGKIFPEGGSPKQTVMGRRKRFLKALEESLAPHGWKRNLSWWVYNEPALTPK